MKSRYVVLKLLHRVNAYCVDDTKTNRTKAAFYDEAAEDLAKDFCRHINLAAKKANTPPRRRKA